MLAVFIFVFMLLLMYRPCTIMENFKKFSSNTSDIVIDKRKGVVIKRVRLFIDKDVYEREVYILQLLNSYGFDWCPRLLGTDPSSREITMSYCGERLTRSNQPADTKEQFDKILSDMRHNDIKATELLVDRRGRLRLCDFQWATIDGSLACGIGLWDGKKPHGGSTEFRSPNQKYKI